MWSPFKRLFKKGPGGESTPPETADVLPLDPEPGHVAATDEMPAPVEEPPTSYGAATGPTVAAVPVAEPDHATDETSAPVEEPFHAPAAVTGPTSAAVTVPEPGHAADDLPEETPASVEEPLDTFGVATGPTSAYVPMQESNTPTAMDPIKNDPLSETNDLTLETTDETVSSVETLHPDPITGEPGAHPASVGVGALGAGAAGAAIGALAGPVGIVIGAAIGAIAGGLAGHEVAVSNDESEAGTATGDLNPEGTGSTTDETGRPSSLAAEPMEPITMFPGSDFGSPTVLASGVGATSFTENLAAAESEPETAAAEAPAESGTGFGAEPETPAAVPVSLHAGGDFAAAGESDKEPVSSSFAGESESQETVRMAAYYLYLDRLEAGTPGDAVGDWYAAEREVARF